MNVDNHNSPYAQFRSLPLGTIELLSGFWYQRQALNRDVSLKDGYRKLHEHGNFDNLKLAIGSINGELVWNSDFAGGIYSLKLPGKVLIYDKGNINLYTTVNDSKLMMQEITSEHPLSVMPGLAYKYNNSKQDGEL